MPNTPTNRAWAGVVLAGLALTTGSAADFPPSATAEVRLEVDATEFHVFTETGSLVHQEDLVGTQLVVRDENGGRMTIRIDGVQLDPTDAGGEIRLYGVSAQDPRTEEWHNVCQPGPDGLAMGFPLNGSWSAGGRHLAGKSFIFTCTAGAIGKCVRFGYKPWKNGPNGATLWEYHQACTRMVRADYCGDGRSWTRDGTLIDLYDRLGIQKPEHREGMHFEAAWGIDGAVCVNHTRIPERLTLDALQAMCPGKLRLEATRCTEAAAMGMGEALVMNSSLEN